MTKFNIIKEELKKEEYKELIERQDYSAIANYINNKPLIDNPISVEKVPKPITLSELFECITPQEALEIYKNGLKKDIEDATLTNNRTSLQLLFAISNISLSSNSAANVQNLLTQEIDDPNYLSQIKGQSIANLLNISDVVDAEIQGILTDFI